jgi:HlyD family secretion protein
MNRKRLVWSFLLILLVLGVTVAALVLRQRAGEKPAEPRYLTQPVDLGAVRRTVNASGPLTPVNLVQVGTQVSGTVARIHADFNASVKPGQLLAEIDPALLEADVAQTAAQVRSAEASLALARTRLARAQSLYAQGFIARAEADDAAAQVATAQAAVAQQRAAASRAERNRRNAEIRSPVAGIVTSREVSVGQTVAASLQTPVLFKIAQDLREMQIETAVSEADVGAMREGLKVSFTVDAFPERSFEGVVHQVRNNYSVQQNVVTYTVIVRTRNDDLSLRPGMTGYVSVAVAEREQALRVPNAALRYEPKGAANTTGATRAERTVWRLGADGTVQPVAVTLGVADNRHTEVTSGGLKEGDALVIGERGTAASFGPKFF